MIYSGLTVITSSLVLGFMLSSAFPYVVCPLLAMLLIILVQPTPAVPGREPPSKHLEN